MDELEDFREAAFRLLCEGERIAATGAADRAESLLAQVWTLAERRAPDIANRAAWELAWLLTRTRKFEDAVRWLERVAVPSVRAQRDWSAGRNLLAELRTLHAVTPATLAGLLDGAADLALPHGRSQQQIGAPLLDITSLGSFRLFRNGVPLSPCKSSRSVAIFRYLLTQPHRAAHKDTLMELFWPDASPAEAGHSLHVAISALRRHLDRGGPSNRYVLFEDEQYGINPDAPIADDCRYFEQLCSSGDEYWQDGDRVHAQQAYTCALATYRGDYFVGNGDQSWALVQQQRLLARYLTTLDHLGQILMEQESYEAAIDVYLRLLQRDGYREDVHARVMRCYLSLGRRGAAIRQYESCVALLASELGLEPMAELKALYDLVTSGGDDATAAWDRTHPAPLAEGVAPPRPVPRRARS